jgi:hypothetical protein
MNSWIEQVEKYTPLITAIFGGAGIKLLDKIVSKRSDTFNESAKIRDELRISIDQLREDIERYKEESDEWRKKYWEQVEINIHQKGMLESLQSEFETFKNSK